MSDSEFQGLVGGKEFAFQRVEVIVVEDSPPVKF